MRACVVTGVSTGIGRAIAANLVAQGFHVFGSVRRVVDAEALREAFGEAVTPLVFDITDTESVRASASEVARALGPDVRLAGLVNNAGFAVPAPLLHIPLDELRQHLEVNAVAHVGVIQAYAPLLGADRSRPGKPGRIVNIISTSGRVTHPFMGAYCAAKHATESITDALRRELMIYGIDVIAIEPGMVVTPIWEKAKAFDPSTYDATDYKPSFRAMLSFMYAESRKGLAPEAIANAVHRALTDPKPAARIAVVPQKFKNWTVPRLLPDRALDKFIAALIGLKPPSDARAGKGD
jgi:NAD(P)-dependent dehydrogenase (short-subunit alcohol dehydrogenase family)